MSDIHRLIYVSAARGDMTAEQLDSILAVSRRNNELAGLTGLLLFHDGSFFQVIEGARNAVMRTFSAIQMDARHSSVIVLQATAATTRAFPSWSMGYVKAHALSPDQKVHLVDLSQLVGREEPASLSSSPAVSVQINTFLGSFREFADI